METIQSVSDFKKIFNMNKGKNHIKVIKAEEVTVDDEWMQDSRWDEIYKQEKKRNGKV